MVSFALDTVKFLLIYRHLQNTYWFKRGASPLLVPRSIGLRIAPSVETSNAESPTPMYVYNTPYRTIRQTVDDDILVRRYITPLGAFPLLCS